MGASCCFRGLVIAALLTGCSARSAYEGLRSSQQLQCDKYPLAEQERCRARAGVDYDTYRAQREAATQGSVQ